MIDALDFPVLYASGRDGWAGLSHEDPSSREAGVSPLLEVIRAEVPEPEADVDGTLQMRVTSLDRNDFVGRIVIGRVSRGVVRTGTSVTVCGPDANRCRPGSGGCSRLKDWGGVRWSRCPQVICVRSKASRWRGSATPSRTGRTPSRFRESPSTSRPSTWCFGSTTVRWRGVTASTSPRGRSGIGLDRELEANVALRVEPGDGADSFRVSGRGLLHLGILLEQMRREGYEVVVGRPEVVLRKIDGKLHEPWERVSVDAPPDAAGAAIEMIGSRGGEIQVMETRGSQSRIEGLMPSRGLIGLRTRLLNASGGEAILHHTFEDWRPAGPVRRERGSGVMVSMETGRATPYSLLSLSERAVMFVEPGDDVYEGMVVGENSRDNDLDVNPARAKAFTNVRESNKEATVVMKAARKMTLEMALEYIAGDEAVEITPNAIRMRKLVLKEVDRKRAQRQERQQTADAAGR